MTEEMQKELLRLAKQAMVFISVNCEDRDFVFEFRDVIRKIEKGGTHAPDEVAGSSDGLH